MKRVELTYEDCYCGIETLYQNVAKTLGVTNDDVYYDCRKICVTKAVLDAVRAFYENEKNADVFSVSVLFIHYGPKANLDGDGYFAEVEDGFIMEGR